MTIQLEAPVVAHLCSSVKMPWPLPWRSQWDRSTWSTDGEHLPIPITDDAAGLLARRLYKALTGEECVAAWAARDTEKYWRLVVTHLGHSLSPVGLDGVPSHVTDPHEALAWAIAWWCNVKRLQDEVRPVPLPTLTWPELWGLMLELGLPLWLPLRDGEPVSLERET